MIITVYRYHRDLFANAVVIFISDFDDAMVTSSSSVIFHHYTLVIVIL